MSKDTFIHISSGVPILPNAAYTSSPVLVNMQRTSDTTIAFVVGCEDPALLAKFEEFFAALKPDARLQLNIDSADLPKPITVQKAKAYEQ